MPGVTSKAKPITDHGAESSKASGRRKGKKALIAGDSGTGRRAIAYALEADLLARARQRVED
jgi:hypothetical protein